MHDKLSGMNRWVLGNKLCACTRGGDRFPRGGRWCRRRRWPRAVAAGRQRASQKRAFYHLRIGDDREFRARPSLAPGRWLHARPSMFCDLPERQFAAVLAERRLLRRRVLDLQEMDMQQGSQVLRFARAPILRPDEQGVPPSQPRLQDPIQLIDHACGPRNCPSGPDSRCFAIPARRGYERPSSPAYLPFLPWRWRQMRNSTAPAATTIAATRPLTASGSTGASATGQSHVRTCGADRSSSSYVLVTRAGALRLRGQDRSGNRNQGCSVSGVCA
jgi:hypothetical protein